MKPPLFRRSVFLGLLALILASPASATNLDIFVGNSLCLGDGTGTFTCNTVTIGPGDTLAVGDLDGNGELDLIKGNKSAGSYVCLNTGGIFTCSILNTSPYIWDASIGDLDGDGDNDFVFSRSSQRAGGVNLNNGDGTFGPATLFPLLTGKVVYDVELGDMDNDGDLDAVYLTNAAGTYLCLNDGSANFSCAASGQGGPYELVLFDMNGDGNLDRLAGGGTLQLCPGNGNGTYATCSTLPGNEGRGIAVADYDGDLDMDLVLAGINTINRVCLGIGTADLADFTCTDIDPSNVPNSAVVSGDIDNDGDPDVVFGGFGNSSVCINDGAANLTCGAGYGGSENGLVLADLADLPQAVELGVSKTESADPVIAGSGAGNLTYTVTVTNNGTNNAGGFQITEDLTLPAGVSVDSITPSAGSFITTTAPDGMWSVSGLAVGASETLTVVLTVDGTATSGTDVVNNTATLTAIYDNDTNGANNSATESTSILRETDLAITKDDSVTSAVPGETLIYTIVASNAGPSDAVAATVADPFPAGLSGCAWTCVPTGTGVCSASGNGDINESVDLAAGDTVTFTVTCTIDVTAAGTLSNTATVAAGAGANDPSTGDNSATDNDTALLPAVFFDAVTHAAEDETVDVPIQLATAGQALGSMAFSIDYDASCLDPDVDDDGTLDSVTFHTPGDFNVTLLYDALDTDGEIDVSIADFTPPIAALGSGDLLTVHYAVTCPANPPVPVDAAMVFSLDPSVTFGDTAAHDVTGVQVDGLVRVWPGPRGDCNSSDALGSADLTATGLEIFDGDGDDWFDAPSPTYAGSPVGCDANDSTVIAAGDVTCVNQLIFRLDCGGVADSFITPWAPPELEISTVPDGERVWIRARLTSNGHAVGSLAFSLDLDPSLPLAALDGNGDGRPDHLRFPNGAPGLAMVRFDAGDTDGELDVLLADLRRSPLAEGVVVEVGVPAAGAPAAVVPWNALRLSSSPAPSFGSVTGADLDGTATVEGTLLFVDGFESGDTDSWSQTVW